MFTIYAGSRRQFDHLVVAMLDLGGVAGMAT
jgi:hypothetical protein